MITLCFGKPGVGKSTLLARLAHRNEITKLGMSIIPEVIRRILRKLPGFRYYDFVYCTDPCIKDTIPITYENLGSWQPAPNSLFLLEEVGLGFSNRDWKKMTALQKRFFAKHRHSRCDIFAVSQTVDCDISIRHRALRLWQLSKFFDFTIMTPIKFKIGVNNETHTLDEIYSVPEKIKAVFAFLAFRYKFIYRPRYYKYFDSYEDDMAGKYPRKGPC